MTISKKHKRQVRSAVRRASAKGEIKRPKMTWSFDKGDLVKVNDDEWGIITESRSDGYFTVFTPMGAKRYHAKKIEKIQVADRKEKPEDLKE